VQIMTQLSLHMRAVWWRGLYVLLFPLVFAVTWLESASQDGRDLVIKCCGAVVLMSIGLACAAATGGRL
jgi:hypothetical protein